MERLDQKSSFSYVEILIFLLLTGYEMPFLTKFSNFIGCTNAIKDFSFFSPVGQREMEKFSAFWGHS